MEWFNLIREVRKRPFLYVDIELRSAQIMKNNWEEVSSCLGLDEKVCRREWSRLRRSYVLKHQRVCTRIEKEKRFGVYSSEKNYDSSWIYYKHLKFLDTTLALKKIKKQILNDESDDGEKEDNEQGDENIIEIDDSDNDNLSTSSTNLNISNALHVDAYETNSLNKDNSCSNDKESYINSPCDESTKTMAPKNKINIEVERKSTSNELDSWDCKESQEKLSAQQIKSTFKNIETTRIKDEPVDGEQSNQLNIGKTSDASSNKHPSTDNSYNLVPKRPRLSFQNAFINSQENNEKIPMAHEVKDLDLKFFLSFLPHMKTLSQFQNLDFRSKVSELIHSILRSRKFKVNDYAGMYEEQCALVKKYGNTKDPDCNFLVSFLPHVKSLSRAENTQLRIKMSDLMFNM